MKGQHITYTPEQLAWVEAHRALPRAKMRAQFVARFGREDVTVDHLKALCTRKGWTRLVPWSDAEMAYLRQHYPHEATRLVATALGRSVPATHAWARKLGLTKSPDFLASAASGRLVPGNDKGAATRFKPGHVSPTKGQRRGTTGRSAETQFVKGRRSPNYQPVGSERLVCGYRFRKVADELGVPWTKNWRQVHLIEWEAVHGPVPEGHALKCVDGDRLNCDPANWVPVPRGMLPLLAGGAASRVSYDQAPAELKPALMTLARLRYTARARAQQGAA